jgi:hypothetical protein
MTSLYSFRQSKSKPHILHVRLQQTADHVPPIDAEMIDSHAHSASKERTPAFQIFNFVSKIENRVDATTKESALFLVKRVGSPPKINHNIPMLIPGDGVKIIVGMQKENSHRNFLMLLGMLAHRHQPEASGFVLSFA